MNTLINNLLLFGHLDQEQITHINSLTKQVRLHKGEYLAEPGHTISFLAFINTGVMRFSFYNRRAENITNALIGEGNFVSSSNPLYPPVLQTYYIQAMTECDLSIIDTGSMEKLSVLSPNWDNIVRRVANNAISERRKRILPPVSENDWASIMAQYLQRFENLGRHLEPRQLFPFLNVQISDDKQAL